VRTVGLLVLFFCMASVGRSQVTASRSTARVDSARVKPRLIGIFDDETGRPLADVDIVDLVNGSFVRTDQTGTTTLSWLSRLGTTDSAAIQVRKIGYREERLPVDVRESFDITLVLRRVTELSQVTVTESPVYLSPNLRDFEERRLHSIGTFYTPAEISQFVQRGLDSPNGGLDSFLRIKQPSMGSNRLGGSTCGVLWYFNGSQVLGPPAADANSYDAMEYYSSASVPARFAGSLRGQKICAVVVLWGRDQRR
jgi:hypothetical protein